MKKKLLLALMLPLALNLYACSTSETDTPNNTEEVYEYKVPEFEEDFVEVFANDADYTFGDYCSCRSMIFTLVSSREISEKDEIIVTFNPSISCEASVDISSKEVMPFDVFEAYQGDNWAEYAEKMGYDLYDLQTIYDENVDTMPVLYQTTLTVTPKMIAYDDILVSDMTISVNGVEKTYTFNTLKFTTDGVDNRNESSLVNWTLAVADLNFSDIMDEQPDARIYALENLQFTASEPVKIKRMYFLDYEDIVLQRISAESNGMGYIWDMKEPIELGKDEEIFFNIKVQDDAAKHFCSFNRCLIVEYEANGQTYNTCIDVSLRIRDNAFRMLFEEGVL